MRGPHGQRSPPPRQPATVVKRPPSTDNIVSGSADWSFEWSDSSESLRIQEPTGSILLTGPIKQHLYKTEISLAVGQPRIQGAPILPLLEFATCHSSSSQGKLWPVERSLLSGDRNTDAQQKR